MRTGQLQVTYIFSEVQVQSTYVGYNLQVKTEHEVWSLGGDVFVCLSL